MADVTQSHIAILSRAFRDATVKHHDLRQAVVWPDDPRRFDPLRIDAAVYRRIDDDHGAIAIEPWARIHRCIPIRLPEGKAEGVYYFLGVRECDEESVCESGATERAIAEFERLAVQASVYLAFPPIAGLTVPHDGIVSEFVVRMHRALKSPRQRFRDGSGYEWNLMRFYGNLFTAAADALPLLANVEPVADRVNVPVADHVVVSAGQADDETISPKGDDDKTMAGIEKLATILGDESTGEILAIAQNPQLDADEKLRQIARIDTRFYGKQSGELGMLIGVHDSRVRQTNWWKKDRKKHV